jgi:hypothetical protein
MEVNMSANKDREYLSPEYKLVVCFQKSRDGWKLKAQQAKRQVRKLKERLKQVRARRDYWKEAAQQGSPAKVGTSKKSRSAGSAGPR